MNSRWTLRSALAGTLAALYLLAACAATPAAPADRWSWRSITPGLDWARLQVGMDTPAAATAHLIALRLDLHAPHLQLRLSPPSDRGRPLDQMDSSLHALASVNASFFDRQFAPRGLTVSDALPWPQVLVPQLSATLACDRQQRCQMFLDGLAQASALPPGTFTAVAGTPWLVRGGVARTAADDAACAALCQRTHPRTAIGLSADRRWLWVLMAEGRRPEVPGVPLTMLAQQLLALGAHNAINLDGGGSSTLWLRGRPVMNRPANEAAERPLANVLHVIELHDPLQPGTAP